MKLLLIIFTLTLLISCSRKASIDECGPYSVSCNQGHINIQCNGNKCVIRFSETRDDEIIFKIYDSINTIVTYAIIEDFDLSNVRKGEYRVMIIDENGNKMQIGSINIDG